LTLKISYLYANIDANRRTFHHKNAQNHHFWVSKRLKKCHFSLFFCQKTGKNTSFSSKKHVEN